MDRVASTSVVQQKKKRGPKPDISDMEWRRVNFRRTLDLEKRRFEQAEMTDEFERLLCDKLREVRQSAGSDNAERNLENEIKLTTLDGQDMARLENFLTQIVAKCGRFEQQESLLAVLRRSLIDTRRRQIKTSATNEPFCLFCTDSFPVDGSSHHARNSCPNSAKPPVFGAPLPISGSSGEPATEAVLDNTCSDMPPTYEPEINLIVPNSQQELTPPPSVATTPEVGEQAQFAVASRTYTPIPATDKQPPASVTRITRQQQPRSQQPAPKVPVVYAAGTSASTSSSQQVKSNGTKDSAQAKDATHTTNASQQATAQKQQQQQQPARASTSQLSNASGFVMPSDDSTSDSDADSIRNVLDSLNRSRANPDDQRRCSTPLSEVGNDVTGQLVIDESRIRKSPIKRLNEEDEDDEEYDHFDTSSSSEEKLKLKMAQAKSLKSQSGRPMPASKKQQQQYTRIKKSNFILLSSPSSGSSAVSSLSQHQAMFRASTSQASGSSAAAASGNLKTMSTSASAAAAANTSGSKIEEVSSRLLKEASERAPRTKKRPKRANHKPRN